ncbi:hypothetical protein COLO4_34766 [Corchorus olitorius]|uniref:Uncharacterized protein n=1 Tax=Corchorus olitorius TaxID=93759 RepID=A0A1R3GJH2_9ROSI|nr:hypothetical protein COLO4_34766 [Corchorus olitorius]
MMYFQSTGRNQRPRGFHVKRGLQFTLSLAVCIWLLYQIKHSNNRKDGGSLQAKFSKGNGVVILGRKGDVVLSDKDVYISDSKDVVILEAEGKQKDRGGGGDNVLDGNADEKGRNESLDKASEDSYGHVEADGEEGKKMEPERQDDLSTNSENVEIEMRDKDNEIFSEDNSQEELENSKRILSKLEEAQKSVVKSLVKLGDDKDLERQSKELKRDGEISIDALKLGKYEETASSEENGDKDLIGKDITKQANDTESTTILGLNEVADGLHGFHDENGIPQGGSDLVVFTLAKSRDSQPKETLHQETAPSLSHQSKIPKSPQIEGAYKSKRNTTDAEKTHTKKEGSKVDAV